MNVISVSGIIGGAEDAVIDVTPLPNLQRSAQLLAGAMRETAFDVLHGARDRRRRPRREQKMEMVWHQHKLMQEVIPLTAIVVEHFEENARQKF